MLRSGALLCALLLGGAAWADPPGDPAWGEILAGLGECGACHTAEGGAPYAGGYAIRTRFGTFYGPNLTPDPETGIGTWTYADFSRAMREGRDEEGHALWPAFPYPSFTRLTDADLADLWAWLRAQEPVRAPNRPHEIRPRYNSRLLLGIWRMIAFDQGAFEPDPDRDPAWNRGAYLGTSIGHCGECHSPRGAFGQVRRHRALAGQSDPPEPAPNLTPSSEGIGSWTEADLTNLLEYGEKPDGDVLGGEMARIVREGSSRLSPEDRAAIVSWLVSLRPWPRHEPPPAPPVEEEEEPWM